MRKKVYKIVNTHRESIMASKTDNYNLKYEKGFEVKTLPGTIGIFCFRRKIDAMNFIERINLHLFLILKVEPIGKGKSPLHISDLISESSFNRFYNDEYFGDKPQKGTICYPAIKVLE